MKFKKISLLLLTVGSLSLSGCTFIDNLKDLMNEENGTQENGGSNNNNNKKPVNLDELIDEEHIDEYYSSINESLEGNSLLTALRTLNGKKRNSTVGYRKMGTDSSSPYRYTDYDPSTAKVNSDGIPYGTKVLSFYSGKSVYSFNREHVWPNSRGGNKVEDDIYMTRPTCTEENEDRGNSVYYTGKNSASDGWDPIAAFKNTLGNYEGVRGESARIIFYCMTAATGLVLNDNTSNSGNNMGRITDLVQWACDNPINEREVRRNIGGEYLQGNRNAFVDHPEYVCKIWGKTNSQTKKACGIN